MAEVEPGPHPVWRRLARLANTRVVVSADELATLQDAVVPRSSYVDANSKLSAGRSASFVVGPAADGGGLLATPIGLRATLLVAAIGGTLSLLWLLPSPILRIHSLAAAKPVAAPPWWFLPHPVCGGMSVRRRRIRGRSSR
jgi:hypothetical protein